MQATTNKANDKYCAIRKNAGLPVSEYRNHYTKSKPGPEGIITCTLVLNSSCAYCKKKGHFKSNCDELNQKKQYQAKIQTNKPAIIQQNKPAIAIMNKINQTKYLAYSDSEEEEEPTQKIIEENNKNKQTQDIVYDISHPWWDNEYWQ